MRLRLPSLHEQEFMSMQEVADSFKITEEELRAILIQKNIIKGNGVPHIHWLYAPEALIICQIKSDTKEIETFFTSKGWFILKSQLTIIQKRKKIKKYVYTNTRKSLSGSAELIGKYSSRGKEN